MPTPESTLAHARICLVVALAALLEALRESAAVKELAGLKPGAMLPGGARVPGTSYELPADLAAQLMARLTVSRGEVPLGLLQALARADAQARQAVLTGAAPPLVDSLYPHLDAASAGGSSFEAALQRLMNAADALFTPTQALRLDELLAGWEEAPATLDALPVQRLVAQFVRNAPP
jgi:hypothetical protein